MAFLGRTDDPMPLVEAEKLTPLEGPRCHLQVIARAALLLYVATGASGRHLRLANYGRDDMRFWWRRFAVSRGAEDPSSELDGPADTWADVAQALKDAALWRARNPTGSLRAMRTGTAGALNELGAAEMVAMWGLVP